uniref:Transmembrane protein n=1 Tax=Chromera velia CCMP2878 TaxID=1169474 RepID=A0A0G4HJE5_9ALVE|eukprot:Cvel_7069.t1-p1 / transcript=Cvel_7069.t1 / gene=Cvel_7069 / organism=Chromera_velia_CCMP2878 / gene_product=hypothetical protein / transcript_product=hypothetical protein / location=Cvel_scaffold361:71769-74028(+) / protein_length=293 / sequence_SO=supercontig / SO=protein_coding / is_pseudo=false
MSDDVLDDALSRCLSRDSLETAVGRLLTAERCTFLSSFEGRHLSGPTLEMSRLKETGREEVREDETPEEGRMKVSQRGASASEPVSAAGSLALCEAPHFTGPQGPSAVHPQGNVPEGLTETASEGVEQAARGEGRAGEGRGEWIEKMEEAVRGDEEIEGGEGTAEALFGVVTCAARSTMSRRSDAVSPEKKRLAVFGTVVFGLAMLDLVNLWLLRRDIRGPVTPFVPARTPLVRLVALFLSLNELVIFALTVVVFSSFRGRALAVSIVSTLLGILWKLVQFLWVCAACKTRAA